MRILVNAAAIVLALGAAGAPTLLNAQTTPPTTGNTSAWDKLKGSWMTVKGAVKEQWGKLTDDDLLEIDGRRDQLVGKLQIRYGISQEEAERQVGEWERKYSM